MTAGAMHKTGRCAAPRGNVLAAPLPTHLKVIAWCVALLSVGRCFAIQPPAAGKPSEDEVKAVYLFNFGKFVHWPALSTTIPANPPETFDLCVIGQDPLTEILTRVTGQEHLDNRPVRVRQIDNPAEARSCAIVFLGANEETRIEQDLAALKGADTLTVGDQPDFLKHGGMLQFVLEDNRVRFGVNLEAVGRTQLQLSSELLKVAAWVTGKPRRGVLE